MATVPTVEVRSRFDIDDEELSRLHDIAFGTPGEVVPWADRVRRFSVTWVGAFDGDALVGFVHAVWDGGSHAFVLDTSVHPAYQHRGIGASLISRLIDDVRAAGCDWLHVDYEPHLRSFYEEACGFRPTDAGLIELNG